MSWFLFLFIFIFPFFVKTQRENMAIWKTRGVNFNALMHVINKKCLTR